MTIGTIIYEHNAPLWFIVAAGIVSVLWLIFFFLRYMPMRLPNAALFALRILFLLVLFWCLLQPLWRKILKKSVNPYFLVAVDTSKSMGLEPEDEAPTRWETVQSVLRQEWPEYLGARCNLALHPFAEELDSKIYFDDFAELAPDGETTLLRDSLRKLINRYKGHNIAGILLLSDGLDSREVFKHWTEEPWPAPIYTVRPEASGLWKMEPDVHLETIKTPRKVSRGWQTRLTAVVSGQETQGRKVDLNLLKDGAMIGKSSTLLPDSGEMREVDFNLDHPDTGNFVYKVEIPPLEGESHTNDNSYSLTVEVREPGKQLLYVEGIPRWESKYLMRTLSDLEIIKLLGFVKAPDGRFFTYGEREGMDLQLTRDQLSRFRIVVIGNLGTDALGPRRTEALEEFVEKGGSLIVLGGTEAWGAEGIEATGLEKLLPARGMSAADPQEGKYPVRPTDEGRAHPVLQSLRKPEQWPPVLSIYPSRETSRAATTLLAAETDVGQKPLVVVQPYGQGEVVVFLTDSLWRWKLDPEYSQFYASFWKRIINWLTPEKEELKAYEVAVSANAEELYAGETITLSARLGGTAAGSASGVKMKCQIETPDERRMEYSMSRQSTSAAEQDMPNYALDYEAETPGLCQVSAVAQLEGREVSSETISFYVNSYTPETRPQPADVELLRALAENSGGRFCKPEEVDDILSSIKPRATEEKLVEHGSLWNKLILLLLMIGLIGLEWSIRKFRNLP